MSMNGTVTVRRIEPMTKVQILERQIAARWDLHYEQIARGEHFRATCQLKVIEELSAKLRKEQEK